MNNIEKNFKGMYKKSILSSVILFLVGIFLLINPETTLYAISYIVGSILIILGIIPSVKYFSYKEKQTYLSFSFISGIFSLIFGIIVIVNPSIIGSIIPLIVGIWMFINGLSKLQYVILAKRENKNNIVSLIIACAILLCGILLIVNPFRGAVILTKLIGISILIYSILDLFECHLLNKTINKKEKKSKVKKENKETIIEAEYEEE